MRPRSVTIVVTALALPAMGRAQAFNDARLLSTTSPAALGQAVGLAVGISSLDRSFGGALVVGDVTIGPGALRLLGARPTRFEGYGVSYALPIVSRSLGTDLSTIIGGELSLGYFGTHLPRSDYIIGNGTSMNAHLAIPLSLRVGTAEQLSFTPYVAPYAEVGAAPSGYWTPLACNMFTPCARFTYSDHYRTSAFGAALGARLTIWRVGVDVATDLWRRRDQALSAAATLRI
jgi:hypothetical protein